MQRMVSLMLVGCLCAGCYNGGGGGSAGADGGEVSDLGPRIVSMTLEPSSVLKRSTGMTDEYIAVEIRTRGFETPIQDVTVFVESPRGKEAATYDPSARTITQTAKQAKIEIAAEQGGIRKTWLRDLPEGMYDVGASIVSGEVELTRDDLTQVAVCERPGSPPCAE
ncbi:MAG: hypothetical protein ABEL76_15545 [Bradymonadaceae bacterium]